MDEGGTKFVYVQPFCRNFEFPSGSFCRMVEVKAVNNEIYRFHLKGEGKNEEQYHEQKKPAGSQPNGGQETIKCPLGMIQEKFNMKLY